MSSAENEKGADPESPTSLEVAQTRCKDQPTSTTNAPSPPRSKLDTLRMRHPSDSIGKDWLVFHLLIITFATGLLDATTYADLQIFCSNQTGNTIVFFVLILGVTLHPSQDTVILQPEGAVQRVITYSSPSILTTGVSLATFLVFGFVFGRFGNWLGNCKRGWLVFTMTFQAAVLLLLAVLLDTSVIRVGLLIGTGQKELNDTMMAFLLAATAGAQVSMARSSGINEIPTAMLTSPFIDFLVDPLLFADPRRAKNEPKVKTRNTRGLYILCLLVGTILGAVMHRQAGTLSVIYFAFALRIVGVFIVMFAPKQRQ